MSVAFTFADGEPVDFTDKRNPKTSGGWAFGRRLRFVLQTGIDLAASNIIVTVLRPFSQEEVKICGQRKRDSIHNSLFFRPPQDTHTIGESTGLITFYCKGDHHRGPGVTGCSAKGPSTVRLRFTLIYKVGQTLEIFSKPFRLQARRKSSFSVKATRYPPLPEHIMLNQLWLEQRLPRYPCVPRFTSLPEPRTTLSLFPGVHNSEKKAQTEQEYWDPVPLSSITAPYQPPPNSLALISSTFVKPESPFSRSEAFPLDQDMLLRGGENNESFHHHQNPPFQPESTQEEMFFSNEGFLEPEHDSNLEGNAFQQHFSSATFRPFVDDSSIFPEMDV